jgi:tripartite-type tricarboxylate transporter receptor subunit TctC
MNMNALQRRHFTALLLSTLAPFSARAADAFPNKPFKIIIPYATGGVSDFIVRTVGELMARRLGQPLVVDYKAGAAGAIGSQFVATSPPDGYTQLLVNPGQVIARYATAKPTYDAVNSFTPIGLISQTPMLMYVNSSVPANNLREFIEYAKSQPHGLECGNAGVLSFGHVTAERFARAAGIKFLHVPYKGGPAMTMALRTGETKVMFTTPTSDNFGMVDTGHFKVLGVASREPLPRRPNIPLMSSVIPGFEAQAWYGLLAPAGTPAPIVAALNGALRAALADADLREKFAKIDHSLGDGTTAQMLAIVKAEDRAWSTLIPEMGIKLE